MSLKKRLQQLAKASGSDSEPRASVAVFGKHPGWDDHIDDVAIDAELLSQTKRWLYVEGIRAIVDDGAWDKLEADQVLEEFDHVFFWRVGGACVLGLLWSSRDGKGRTRYPMAVCVHGRNLPQAWFFETALPLLERMREQFKQTTSAGEVRSMLERGRAEIAAAADSQPEASAEDDLDARALSRLADLPQFSGEGGQHVGLQRVLYQIDRDMRAFGPAEGGRRNDRSSSDTSLRAKHLRVPTGGGSANRIIHTWLSVMADHVEPRVPLLVILPPGAEWCDLIVGEPTESSLRCLRITPKAMPLATDVPYTIEDAFVAQVHKAIDASRAGQSAAEVPKADSKSPPQQAEARADAPTENRPQAKPDGAVAAVSSRTSSAGKHEEPSGGSGFLKMGAIVLLLVVVAAVSVVFLQRTGDQDVAHAAPAPAGYSSRQLDAINVADANWVAALRTSAVVDVLAEDSSPSAVQLLSRLRDRSLDAGESDPANITDDAAAARLKSLHEELRRDFDQWLSSIDAVADSHDWPVVAEKMRSARKNVTQVLDAREPVGEDGGRALLAAMSETVDAVATAAAVDEQWAALQKTMAVMEHAGDDDAVLAVFSKRVEDFLAAADSSDELNSRLDRTKALAGSVASALENHWRSGVDREHFRTQSGLYPISDNGLDVFDRWASLVADERFALLNPSHDPRRDHRVRYEVEALLDAIESHKQCGDPPADLLERSQGITTAYAQIALPEWDGTRRMRDSIGQALTDLEDSVQKVGALVAQSMRDCLAECEHRLAQALQDAPELGSAVLASRWETRRDSLAREQGDCQGRLQEANDLRRQLESLAAALAPPDPGQWNVDGLDTRVFATVAAEKREAALTAALDRSPLPGRMVDVSVWQPEIDRYQQWLGDARTYIESLSDIQRQLAALEPGYQIMQRFDALKASAIHADLADLADPISLRLAALREIRQMPIGSDQEREHLVAIIESAEDVQQRLAAWRRLGEGGFENSAVIEHEVRARDALRGALADHGVQGEQLIEAMATDQRRRWIEHARLVENPAVIATAMRHRGSFGVSHDDESLDGRTRFNVMLHSFSRKLAHAKDEQEQARLAGEFRTWVQRNRDLPGTQYNGKVDDLIATLDALENDEPSSDVDYSRLGPGLAGWSVQVLDEGRVIRYRAPSSWGDVAPLVFRRVEPPDAPAAFVCTTEVPVDLFIAAVTESGDWEHLWPLMGHAISSDGRDHRRGPRSWEVIESDPSYMAPAAQWLRTESPVAYAEHLHIDRPSGRHPMQQVSAAGGLYVAHLLGCRLPTYREWHAAYLEGGEAQLQAANLRRGAWVAQVRHVEQVGRLQAERPDEGVFDAGGTLDSAWIDTSPGGSAGENGDHLWFRPVVAAAADQPTQFRDIVGNVAEYVFNDPDSLVFGMNDRSTHTVAQILPNLADQQQADLYVVGCSSLSQPETPPTRLLSLRTPAHLRVFSDVGFRLAFSADGPGAQMTRTVRVERFLEAVAYVPPLPDGR